MTYQLLEIPPANLHVAAVLIQALGELLGCAGTVVAPGAVVGLGRRLRLRRLRRLGRGAAAAEESAQAVANDMADRGADCNTTVCPQEREELVSCCSVR